jgi:hypothetical protein
LAIRAKSDLSQVFEPADIFTRKDAISGLKSSPWAGSGKLVNTPLTVQFLEYDITTFNIAFPIPYKQVSHDQCNARYVGGICNIGGVF